MILRSPHVAYSIPIWTIRMITVALRMDAITTAQAAGASPGGRAWPEMSPESQPLSEVSARVSV
jgi:hypothetical protein